MAEASAKRPVYEAIISFCDMPAEVKDEVLKVAKEAAAGREFEKDQAQHIKKSMESFDGGLWHAVVGKSFGASVAHSNNMLLHFTMGKLHYLVFQSFDETSLVAGGGAGAHASRGAGKKKKDDDEDAE